MQTYSQVISVFVCYIMCVVVCTRDTSKGAVLMRCVCFKSLRRHLLVSHLWLTESEGRMMMERTVSKPSNAIHLCLVIFQLEKQKRLERIRQKRAQLEELILQVCSTSDCVCSLTTGLQQDFQTRHMGIICRNIAILGLEDWAFPLSIHFSI